MLSAGALSTIALPASAPSRKLVVIFQRGGNDGLNTFVPFNDSSYYDYRPTLAIAEPNPSDAHSALQLTSGSPSLGGEEFGLHPSMASLVPLWNAGHLAVMPATHVGLQANRSHFLAQDLVEFGDHMNVPSSLPRERHGWLNRWFRSRSLTTEASGLALFGFANAKSIRSGGYPAMVLTDPSEVSLGAGVSLASPWLIDLRERLQSKSGIVNSSLGQSWRDQQERTYDAVEKLAGLDGHLVANAASYPTTPLGTHLRQTASLFRTLNEVEAVAIDTGGYDTHAKQAIDHPVLLKDISDSLAAFYTDMGDEMNNVAVVVMTEFGRTADENGVASTDHGWASAWWVISKGINGGFYGGWPGLDSDNIGSSGGRFMLNYATDYRQILADLMVNFVPGSVANAEAAFPGFTYGAPLGFV